jgi:uncharacterized protein with HEPN domain
VSSDLCGGRAADPIEALRAAVRVARQALALVTSDNEDTYLANEERQLAIERLLLRFGEALKDGPKDVLDAVDPHMNWAGPIRFRDLAAHWCTDGLDHRLIWRALRTDLPAAADAITRYLAAIPGPQSPTESP